MIIRKGGCNCGNVRLTLSGEPIRTGLCHCLTCRKETGGPFMAFAVWRWQDAIVEGQLSSWKDRRDDRYFCPDCGSSLYGSQAETGEIEVRMGCLDQAPGDIKPDYELWVIRREHWLPDLTPEQFEREKSKV